MASRLHYGIEEAYFKISSDFEKVLVSSYLIIRYQTAQKINDGF